MNRLLLMTQGSSAEGMCDSDAANSHNSAWEPMVGEERWTHKSCKQHEKEQQKRRDFLTLLTSWISRSWENFEAKRGGNLTSKACVSNQSIPRESFWEQKELPLQWISFLPTSWHIQAPHLIRLRESVKAKLWWLIPRSLRSLVAQLLIVKEEY